MIEGSLFYMIPVVMFLLMLVTKSYKKSVTNSVSISALLIAGYIYPASPTNAFLVMATSIFIMQIRAIVNHKNDRWIKR